MIKHIVMWKLKESAEGRTKQENAWMIKQELEQLKGTIREIVSLEVGINIDVVDCVHTIGFNGYFAVL